MERFGSYTPTDRGHAWMERGQAGEGRLRPCRTGRRGRYLAGAGALGLALTTWHLPVYADTGSGAGSTGTSAATNATADAGGLSGQAEPGGTGTPTVKLSSDDAVQTVTARFGDLVNNLTTPTTNLQPNPLNPEQMVYEIDWGPMALDHAAGPRLSDPYAHATVDADTGQVLTFQYTGSNWVSGKAVSLAAARQAATAWV